MSGDRDEPDHDRKLGDGSRASSSAAASDADETGDERAPSGRPAFPVVGIGASAGGLDAYRQLLASLPPEPGVALVLVQHLDPSHESMLAEILSRETTMPVIEVVDEPDVRPNHVYVIPPNRSMVMDAGRLRLQPRSEDRGHVRTIDIFLRSLAERWTHQAVGVILSGTGNDGVLGLEAVKAEGGITFAQDHTAQHDGMPRAAIAAGCVDFVLPPDAIAAELVRIGQHPYVPPPPSRPPEAPGDAAPPSAEIYDILRILHEKTGADFTDYKSTTLYRRITRRMLLHKLDKLSDYLSFLRANPVEIHSLYRDILISVTSFFRDPDAIEILQRDVIPVLLRDRSRREPLRVWVLGCSTGEEAYSIAMAISEVTTSLGAPFPTQIFATDLNDHGIEKARAGLYAKNIAEDVSPDRLRRFFIETDSGYQVTKSIRDMCVFARHNVLSDPPFSRLNLITCRNLLIYMEPVLQRRVVPLFHYALRSGGFLWLGSSETIGTFTDLFSTIDATNKIYMRRPGATPGHFLVPVGPPSLSGTSASGPRTRATDGASMLDFLREADRITIAKYAPPAVLVNSDLEVLQVRGDTSPYLSLPPGKPTMNVLKMAREGLLVGLRAALQRAEHEGTSVRQDGIRVRANGGMKEISLEIVPIGSSMSDARHYLILFESPNTPSAVPERPPLTEHYGDDDRDQQVTRLLQELAATREYMQSLIEEKEAANEELQSANEEIQSSNEELQSINEELQTSREEIQSTNEELTTVNEELYHRNELLSQPYNDLSNFLSSTNLALVMLAPDLTIRLFTPQAERLFNLRSSDIGRSFNDLNLSINLPNLGHLVADVMDTARVHEVEVQDTQGHWYLLRVRPYKTLDKRIDGAVLVMVDIDSLKQHERQLRRQAELLEQTHEPIIVWQLGGGVVTYWNHAAENLYGFSRDEATGRSMHQLHVVGNGREFEDITQKITTTGAWSGQMTHRTKTGERIVVDSLMVLVREDEGDVVLETIRDVTRHLELEGDLQQRDAALAEGNRSNDQFLAMLAHELRNPLAPLRNTIEIVRQTQGSSESMEWAVELMERQVRKLTRMVDDLLDVSRISRGKITLRKDVIDLTSVVPRAVEATRQLIETQRHDLSVSIATAPLFVVGDAIRLEQTMANMLNNAAKFTNRGGRIWLSLEKQGHDVVLTVRDNGIGIPAEVLPRVFEAFTQADVTPARERGGLGIGLSLVKQLVELHGGSVKAQSDGPGHGATFTVRLPLASDADVRSRVQPNDAERRRAVKPRRVLVVDDQEDVAESFATLLRLSGHDVRVAPDGPAALSLAASFQPQFVVLDIGLPGMDGYEVARQLKKLAGLGEVRIVALSGYGREEDTRLSHEVGIEAHFVKPVDPAIVEELMATERSE